MTIIRAAPNPTFAAGQPLSYESILCRLAGWWTMEPNQSTLTPIELALDKLEPINDFVPQSGIV